MPKGWLTGTPAGKLNFGVNLIASLDHPCGAGWRHSKKAPLTLATPEPGDAAAVNARLGAVHEHTSRTAAPLLNPAIAWAPGERALLSAETQKNSKRDVFGGTVNTGAGPTRSPTGSLKLDKDRFGVDLSASRQAGAAIGTLWTLGVGWDGLVR